MWIHVELRTLRDFYLSFSQILMARIQNIPYYAQLYQHCNYTTTTTTKQFICIPYTQIVLHKSKKGKTYNNNC